MRWPWQKAEQEAEPMAEPQPKPPITITGHAMKRLWERYPDTNSLTEEETKAHLQARYEKSQYIWFGTTSAYGTATFYMDDEMVLVVKEDGALSTVYPCEYGFGTEIDETIRKKLFKSVLQLQEQVRKAEEKTRTGQAAIMREIDTIEFRIATLKAELDLQESAKVNLTTQQSKLHSEESFYNVKLASEADKLVMSKRYAYETLATVQAVANSARNGKK